MSGERKKERGTEKGEGGRPARVVEGYTTEKEKGGRKVKGVVGRNRGREKQPVDTRRRRREREEGSGGKEEEEGGGGGSGEGGRRGGDAKIGGLPLGDHPQPTDRPPAHPRPSDPAASTHPTATRELRTKINMNV